MEDMDALVAGLLSRKQNNKEKESTADILFHVEIPAMNIQAHILVSTRPACLEGVFDWLQEVMSIAQEQFTDGCVSADVESSGEKLNNLRCHAVAHLQELTSSVKRAERWQMKAETLATKLNEMRESYLKEITIAREQIHKQQESWRRGEDYTPDKVFQFAESAVNQEAVGNVRVPSTSPTLQELADTASASVTEKIKEKKATLLVKENQTKVDLKNKFFLSEQQAKLISRRRQESETMASECVQAAPEVRTVDCQTALEAWSRSTQTPIDANVFTELLKGREALLQELELQKRENRRKQFEENTIAQRPNSKTTTEPDNGSARQGSVPPCVTERRVSVPACGSVRRGSVPDCGTARLDIVTECGSERQDKMPECRKTARRYSVAECMHLERARVPLETTPAPRVVPASPKGFCNSGTQTVEESREEIGVQATLATFAREVDAKQVGVQATPSEIVYPTKATQAAPVGVNVVDADGVPTEAPMKTIRAPIRASNFTPLETSMDVPMEEVGMHRAIGSRSRSLLHVDYDKRQSHSQSRENEVQAVRTRVAPISLQLGLPPDLGGMGFESRRDSAPATQGRGPIQRLASPRRPRKLPTKPISLQSHLDDVAAMLSLEKPEVSSGVQKILNRHGVSEEDSDMGRQDSSASPRPGHHRGKSITDRRFSVTGKRPTLELPVDGSLPVQAFTRRLSTASFRSGDASPSDKSPGNAVSRADIYTAADEHEELACYDSDIQNSEAVVHRVPADISTSKSMESGAINQLNNVTTPVTATVVSVSLPENFRNKLVRQKSLGTPSSRLQVLPKQMEDTSMFDSENEAPSRRTSTLSYIEEKIKNLLPGSGAEQKTNTIQNLVLSEDNNVLTTGEENGVEVRPRNRMSTVPAPLLARKPEASATRFRRNSLIRRGLSTGLSKGSNEVT